MRFRTKLPLRLRLTAAFALSVSAVLAGLAVFVYARLGTELRRSVDFELRSRAGVITTALRQHGPVPVNSGRGVIDPDEAFAQVLDRHGQVVDTSRAVRTAPMLAAARAAAIERPTFLDQRVAGINDPTRLLATPVRTGGQDLVVVVGANLGDENDALHRLLLLLALGIPAAIVLASGIGWLVAGAALRPVERMRRDAAAASAAKGGGTLAVPATGDELARLATTLNELLTRQREALAAEHRFIDEASHDLRTPLAVLKAELDVALRRPRSSAELEQAVRIAAQQTDHLVRLAEDLLVHARTRHGPLQVHREPVQLAQFCADCAAPFEAQGNVITVQAPDHVVQVDPVLLRQAIRNALDNAVRHGTGVDVTLHAEQRDGQIHVTVGDAGPGLPERVRGRLQRADTGAEGLGLSIVAAAAEAHGGFAEAGSNGSGGTRIHLVIPDG